MNKLLRYVWAPLLIFIFIQFQLSAQHISSAEYIDDSRIHSLNKISDSTYIRITVDSLIQIHSNDSEIKVNDIDFDSEYIPKISISADGTWLTLATNEAAPPRPDSLSDDVIWMPGNPGFLTRINLKTSETAYYTFDFPSQPSAVVSTTGEVYAVTDKPGTFDTQQLIYFASPQSAPIILYESKTPIIQKLFLTPEEHLLVSTGNTSYEDHGELQWFDAKSRTPTPLNISTKGDETDIKFGGNNLFLMKSDDTDKDSIGVHIYELMSASRKVEKIYAKNFYPAEDSWQSLFYGLDSSGRFLFVSHYDSEQYDDFISIIDITNGKTLNRIKSNETNRIIFLNKQRQLIELSDDFGSINQFTRDFSESLHFKSPSDIDIVLQKGHTASINDIAFSNDGRLMATSDKDGTIKIWDAKKGLLIRNFRNVPGKTIAFNPDGTMIVAGNSNGASKFSVLNVSTGEEVLSVDSGSFDYESKEYNAISFGIEDVVWHPNNEWLIIGGDNVSIWNAKTGTLIKSLDEISPTTIAVSENGKWLAAGDDAYEKNDIHIVDLDDFKTLAIIEEHTSEVQALAFSKDGDRLISSGTFYDFGDTTKGVMIWDWKNNKLEDILSSDPVRSINFDQSGRYLLTGSDLWDFEKRIHLNEIGNDYTLTAITPDAQYYAYADNEKLQLYETFLKPKKREISYPSDKNSAIVFQPAKPEMVVKRDEEDIKLLQVIDLNSGEILASRSLPDSLFPVLSGETFEYSHKGDSLFLNLKHSLLILNSKSLNTIDEISVVAKNSLSFSNPDFAINSASNEFFATLSSQGKDIIRRWDMKSQTVIDTLIPPTDDYWRLNLSPAKDFILISKIDSSYYCKISDCSWKLLYPDNYPSWNQDNSILSTRSDDEIFVWDVQTAKLLYTFESSGYYPVSFNTAGDILIDAEKRWRLDDGKKLSDLDIEQRDYSFTSFSNVIPFPDGRHTGFFSSNSATIVDFVTGALVESLPLEDYVQQWKLAPDGNTLISSSQNFDEESSKISIWKPNLSTAVFNLTSKNVNPQQVLYNPKTSTLLVNDYNSVQIWNHQFGSMDRSVPVNHDYLQNPEISISDEGDLYAIAYRSRSGGLIEIRDVSTNTVLDSLPDGNSVRLKSKGVWGVLSSDAYSDSSKSDTLWLGNPKEKEPVFMALPTTNERKRVFELSSDGSNIAVSHNSDSILVINSNSLKTEYILKHDVNDFTELEFSQNENLLASLGTSRDDIIIWDINTGDTLSVPDMNTAFTDNIFITAVSFSPDGKIIAGAHNSNISLWDTYTGQFLGTLSSHSLDVTDIEFSNNNQLISSSIDGLVKVWNVEKREVIANYIGLDKDEFVAFTPDLFYRSSQNALSAIAFKYQDTIYDFNSFDLLLNRPDILIDRLGADKNTIQLYEKARERRLAQLGIQEKDLNIDTQRPEVRIDSGIPTSTNERTIAIPVSVNSEDKKLNTLFVNVNNVPAFGKDGITISGNKWDSTLTLQLSNGENQIDITAVDEKGSRSLNVNQRIVYTGSQRKPALHLVTLGVSDYKDDQFDLTYAASDTDSLVSFWNDKKNRFSDINIYQLKDEEVTKENFENLSDRLNNIHVDDLLIFFVAGHGVLDTTSTYYFGTHSIDFEQPASEGLSFTEIENFIDKSAARNKLLLMDTCHSGESDPLSKPVYSEIANSEEAGNVKQRESGRGVGSLNAGSSQSTDGNSFLLLRELFADFRSNAGATTIAASAGAEFAYESEKWGGGVFTYALLEGLRDGHADLNLDGIIKVSELQKYVQDRVTSLTNGRQTPTVRQVNLKNDFRLY